MAKTDNLGDFLTDLATGIKTKEGSSNPINAQDFRARVEALPSPKPEETKTVTPNFASGDMVITPTSGKVMTQVTLTKPADCIPENIAKDKNICGVLGTFEGGGGGATLYDYALPCNFSYTDNGGYPSPYNMIVLFGLKSSIEVINTKNYYNNVYAVIYSLLPPYTTKSSFLSEYELLIGTDLISGATAINLKAPFDTASYDCLGIYYIANSSVNSGNITFAINDVYYQMNKTTSGPITASGAIFEISQMYACTTNNGMSMKYLARFSPYTQGVQSYLPKLINQTLDILVPYND